MNRKYVILALFCSFFIFNACGGDDTTPNPVPLADSGALPLSDGEPAIVPDSLASNLPDCKFDSSKVFAVTNGSPKFPAIEVYSEKGGVEPHAEISVKTLSETKTKYAYENGRFFVRFDTPQEKVGDLITITIFRLFACNKVTVKVPVTKYSTL